MRARIFTPYERELLKWWLGLGPAPKGRDKRKAWDSLRMLRYRLRRAQELIKDVVLYLLAWAEMEREAPLFIEAGLPVSERLKAGPIELLEHIIGQIEQLGLKAGHVWFWLNPEDNPQVARLLKALERLKGQAQP
ncbi:MAG: hypothetical protein DRN03_06150 [Thermoplasmata archaeon]|nr:MAG: hypothetical protein DRN03_06150 [Thermoplasmata archaeon]